MILDREQMEHLKKKELAMLKQFIFICNQLNLRYYLLGGTLLGAVRHQGFIPWDDDIDIGMIREDYEVFRREGHKYMPDYYFIQTKESDPEYPHNFMKIRDSRTTFIETSLKKFRINHGIFIDIFPLDFYPKSKIGQMLLEYKKKIINYRIQREFTISSECRCSKKNENLMGFVILFAKLFYPTIRAAQDAKEKLYIKKRHTDYVANHSGAWGQKEIAPVAWFEEGVELFFEGLKVTGPKKYKKWLAQVYGDYMQLPPIEKRISHHYNEVIDMERSYKEYM